MNEESVRYGLRGGQIRILNSNNLQRCPHTGQDLGIRSNYSYSHISLAKGLSVFWLRLASMAATSDCLLSFSVRT